MSDTRSRFDARTPADNARLVREYPLGWIVSNDDAAHDEALYATPLPLRAQHGADDGIVRIVGHFARTNPQVAALRRRSRALFLFVGPHGYISPSWMTDRTQAPTWNYATVRCHGEVRIDDDPALLLDAIRDLVEAHEAGRPKRWSVDEMGSRYQMLERAIVGFEACIDRVEGRFKLGQDERPDVLANIVRGLAGTRGATDPLLAWMQAFNPERSQD